MLVFDQIKYRLGFIVVGETYLLSDWNPPTIEGWTAFSVSRDRKRAYRRGGILVKVSDKIFTLKFDNMSRVFSSLCRVYRLLSLEFFEKIKALIGGKKCDILGDFIVNFLIFDNLLTDN